MLKLDKSKNINDIAIHLTTTSSFSDMAFVYSQSYDLSSGVFSGDVVDTKGKYRIVEVPGFELPTPSGQYDITIYEGVSAPVTWNTANQPFGSNPWKWEDADQATPIGDALRTIRAWISGSNEVPTTSYISSNEEGKYITYNS